MEKMYKHGRKRRIRFGGFIRVSKREREREREREEDKETKRRYTKALSLW